MTAAMSGVGNMFIHAKLKAEDAKVKRVAGGCFPHITTSQGSLSSCSHVVKKHLLPTLYGKTPHFGAGYPVVWVGYD